MANTMLKTEYKLIDDIAWKSFVEFVLEHDRLPVDVEADSFEKDHETDALIL
jgi:hypothetical protein